MFVGHRYRSVRKQSSGSGGNAASPSWTFAVRSTAAGAPSTPWWRRSVGFLRPRGHERRRALSVTEREEISRGFARGCSLRQIGRHLRRAPSTVSREVRRQEAARTIAPPWRTHAPGTAPAGRSGAGSRAHSASARWWRRSWPGTGPRSRLRGGFNGPFRTILVLHVSHETIYRSGRPTSAGRSRIETALAIPWLRCRVRVAG